MSYLLRKTEQNLFHGKFSTFPEDLITHAISTRIGGVSQSPFNSLNLALHVGDVDENVLANREKFAQSLGFELDDIVTPNQIHGDKIFRVEEVHRGRGSKTYADSIPKTDALITNIKNLPLMLCFADCVPIMFVDVENFAVGIAHGGWKGTVNKIAAKTFLSMRDNFGTTPENCLVGIGPSIGACCYEVGENVIDACKKNFPNNFDELIIKRNRKNYFDLWTANKIQLEEVGLPAKNIDVAGECTCCNSNFYFSYRAARQNNLPETGRIAAFIALKEF
ncbi:MAG: peptidoglycan editing factor PgeF [Selenomonadaceae bacterium]|nr:peptidoglycan editing factor PgeF [Selenomonadaceae bacterium]